jgi:amino acid adenylation domain-containing protein
MSEKLYLNLESDFTFVIDLLHLAKGEGVEIALKDGQLQLKIAGTGDIDQKLVEKIRANKEAIIEFFENKNFISRAVSENYSKINKIDRGGIKRIPLSFGQERLWFIDQLEGSVQYHSSDVLRLNGMVDLTALENALKEIVNRHEVLRTVIGKDEYGPFQQVKDEGQWKLSVLNGERFKNEVELLNFIEGLINEPFNLAQDDLLRVHLIKLKDREHLMVIIMHHIACDGWSKSLFVKELSELYEAFIQHRDANLAQLQIQFSDFAVWQRQYLQGELLDKKLGYWKEKLSSVAPLELPTDYPRPEAQSSKGTSTDYKIDEHLSSELTKLSQRHGTTLFATLLAAFKVLLYRYSGQEDICVGTSISDRPSRDVEDLIGFFVNTLALRSLVDSNSPFTHLLQQVKLNTLEAYENQDVPFEKVVEAVIKERDNSRHPLFQVMLVLGNTMEVCDLALGDVIAVRQPTKHNSSKFDITFFFTDSADGLQLTVAYSTDLFKLETIERMIGHFNQLLLSIVQDPQQQVGKLRILTHEEEKQLLGTNLSVVEYPKDKSIIDLFQQQVAINPNRTALVFSNHSLSYRQLNEKANQLARYLITSGVKEETLVPIYVDRGLEMIVAMLGVLKAGAAYVPMESEYPADRIKYVLEETKSPVVITTSCNDSNFANHPGMEVIQLSGDVGKLELESVENLEVQPKPRHLAYVIYTSGSTGKPKGVMIEHRSLLDYLFGLQERTGIQECSSYALVSSISTDLGNTVLFSSLIFGGTLHLFSKDAINDPDKLNQYFQDTAIDCLKIVPSHWKALSISGRLLLPKKMLIFGGEALQRDLIQQIRRSGTTCTLINHYGPTETTIGKLLHVIDTNKQYHSTIPIGKPFSNTRVYILSKDMELSPIGVPGQLCISGDGVARGYLNSENFTKSKFVENPFDRNANSLMYQTGDLVKYLDDGNIEFIGRNDEQVKIRGYRVELKEIESLLEQSGLVKQAVVLAKEDVNNGKFLVAYVVANGAFDRDVVKSYLNGKLPEYSIPVVWMELDQFPLLLSGKIDRKALPDPSTTTASADKFEAPRNEMEARLVEIWQELLEVEKVGVRHNFFELGGHSLLAIQLVSTVRRQLQLEVSIGDVFDYPTVELLAEHFSSQRKEKSTSVIHVQPRSTRIPLSFNQERLWFIDRLEGSVQYHRPEVLRLKGSLSVEALIFALRTIVERHESLRTVILEEGGEPYQFIVDKDEWQLNIVDGTEFKKDIAALKRFIEGLIEKPFDVSKDYMLRAHLIEINADEHLLVIVMHHIASDGSSLQIFLKELSQLYTSFVEDRRIQLTPLSIQYSDYAIWQRQQLLGDKMNEKLGYWKQKLAGIEPLQLPTDYPRAVVQSAKGAIISFDIDKKLAAGLQQLSQKHGCTLYMTMLSAFNVLLFRYSNQDEICVGSAMGGRQQDEVKENIGFFVNTVALRAKVDPAMPFAKLLQEIRTTTIEAFEHQEVPLEKVVNAVVKDRDITRNPLFQVMFDLGTAHNISNLKLGNLNITAETVEHQTTKFDLTFSIAESDVELKGYITYSTDLYDEKTIRRMAGHYVQLLTAILKDPNEKVGELSILTEWEQQQLLVDFNNTKVDHGKDETFVDLFEKQVSKSPHSVALISEVGKVTYSELSRRANQLAHYLRDKGVKEDTLIPICIDRSVEMVIGVLGILLAGAAYVPIDPEFPVSRMRYVLGDTKASVVVTNKASIKKLPVIEGVEVIQLTDEAVYSQSTGKCKTDLKPSDLAYVIYTSGSTGKPKGVMIEHASLVNYLLNSKTRYTEDDQSLSGTFMHLSYTFDASITGMFMPLIVGKSVVVPSNNSANVFDQSILPEYAPYSFIKLTPAHLVLLQPHTKDKRNELVTRTLVVGGEALYSSHFEFLVQEGMDVQIVNEYGPTEATVGCSTHTFNTSEIRENRCDRVLIGKPIDNIQLHIVDPYNTLVPIGVYGEICISGAGLARGYLNQPALTSEKFIVHSFRKDYKVRLYKTGDIGRWLEDGTIEFMGRNDNQVKIRGYRVELGEIESLLQQCGVLKQAVVLTKEDSSGGRRLVAYVVPKGVFEQEIVVSYLQERLPEYMLPSQWIEIEALPVTSNGKIDRKALLEININQQLDGSVQPRSELESRLVNLWQQLLEVDNIGVNDNFFQRGGHSLLAIQLISAIKKELEIELSLRDVFQFSTISDLSRFIELQINEDGQEEDLKEFELLDI